MSLADVTRKRGMSFVSLAPWDPEVLSEWEGLNTGAKLIARKAGGGRALELLMARFRVLAVAGEPEDIDGFLRDPLAVRAALLVWWESPELVRPAFSTGRLTTIDQALTAIPTRMTVSALIHIVLAHFDYLDRIEQGLFAAAVELVRNWIVRTPQVGYQDAVEAVREKPELFLSTAGPVELAARIVDSGDSWRDYLRANGLSDVDAGRFGRLVRNQVYIERLKREDPDQPSTILRELNDVDVLEFPVDEGRTFGHDLLETLALVPPSTPHQEWVDVTLEIAGDPRLSSSAQWRKWWEVVSPQARQAVTRWLSAADIHVFLEAVLAHGKQTSDESLLRMYPERKKFLEGLLESGQVEETRVFLGRRVFQSLKRSLGANQVGTIGAFVSDADKAIILLNCGDFQLVEGSHNFSVHAFLGEPDRLFTDWATREITLDDIRYEMKRRHRLRNNARWGVSTTEVRHQGFWQDPLIRFLHESGNATQPEKLLPSAQYTKLKYERGIPPVKVKPKELAN